MYLGFNMIVLLNDLKKKYDCLQAIKCLYNSEYAWLVVSNMWYGCILRETRPTECCTFMCVCVFYRSVSCVTYTYVRVCMHCAFLVCLLCCHVMCVCCALLYVSVIMPGCNSVPF